jgi:bifunctional non-homologous end joining protein LigD
MLARSGRLPYEDGYAYEPKWDGFRALVRCGSEFRVRSRRGWEMTARLPELAALPIDAVLDGELVALGEDGWPYFPLVCQRLLNGETRIRIVYVIFDVLELDGQPTIHQPYVERRRLLELLELTGPHWQTSPSFEDGEALFAVVSEKALEGIVAKPLRGLYRPGERGWIKVKNKDYWRYELEREAAVKRPGRSADERWSDRSQRRNDRRVASLPATAPRQQR